MNILWYWPFARAEELAWAEGTRRPDDRLVVQVIDREVAPEEQRGELLEVRRDLPDVDRSARGVRWLVSRSTTYLQRARTRSRLLQSEPFDLLHIHYLNRFTDRLKSRERPLVLSVHDLVPHVPRFGSAETRLLQHLYARPQAIIVLHHHLKEALTERFGVDPARVHVVPYPVFASAAVTPRPADRPVPVALFFGALRPNKGLTTLREALALVGSSELTVRIAGRGDHETEGLVRSMASDYPNVTAEIGYVTAQRKIELFREASVVVLPYETFSSQSAVLHDAYGHGRPSVVTDVGALGVTVREDGTGLVVPPGDAQALADALLRVAGPEGDDFARRTSQITAQRSPERLGKQLRAIYDEVVQGS